MSNPTAEALKRALVDDRDNGGAPLSGPGLALVSANEALEPIRALYQELEKSPGRDAEMPVWVFLNKLAPLIYRSKR